MTSSLSGSTCRDPNNRSRKTCCCGGHSAGDATKNKRHHGTANRLMYRRGRNTMNLEAQRRAEVAKYEVAHKHPKYDMKPWRQSILADWLFAMSAEGYTSYLDVGCGKAETMLLAGGLNMNARGCDVVDYLCERDDVDLIEGAHNLPYYTEKFDVTSCNDVMEHIPEHDVPLVLREIWRVTRHAVLLGISRKPGPLHITIRTEEWWLEKIRENTPSGTAAVVFADRIPKIKQPYMWVEVK